MLSAVKAVGGQRPFATGTALLQPETEAALKVIGPRMPDSGTASRMQASNLATGALDVGAQAMTTGAPLVMSAALYNPLAQRLLTKLATQRPQFMQQMAPPLSRAAAGVGGTLTNTSEPGALPAP